MNDLVNFDISFKNKVIENIRVGSIYYNCNNTGIKNKKVNTFYLVKLNDKIYCTDEAINKLRDLYMISSDFILGDLDYCCVDLNKPVLTIYSNSLNSINTDRKLYKIKDIAESFVLNPVCNTIEEIVEEENLCTISGTMRI